LKPVVAIERAASYERPLVEAAVSAAIGGAGGLDEAIPRGAKVFVKMNHLGNHPLEYAIATHPEVVRAVVVRILERTSDVVVGDGLEKKGNGFYETSGTDAMAHELGVKLVNLKDEAYDEVEVPDAHLLKTQPIARRILEADVVVNVPKLKTHMLTLMTCAVKNYYGNIPHGLRTNFHRVYWNPEDFSSLLVDIYSRRPPVMNVVDAITALEGYGPSKKGDPRDVGLVLAGTDGVAVDAVASSIIGCAPEDVLTTRFAADRKVGEARLDRIDMVGESPDAVRVPDFHLPANARRVTAVVERLSRGVLAGAIHWLSARLRERPVVVPANCKGCGFCASHCPTDSIRIRNGVAEIDTSQCIGCFCCQEFCPTEAIDVGYSGAGTVIMAAAKKLNAARRRRKKASAGPA
jgi:uncharacterized protein (DUF362 family)/Pyruvate/2-oxoacid:ferredoxin oxidoreductase delta subunit